MRYREMTKVKYQECRRCGKKRVILAKGLCGPCYTRHRKNYTEEIQDGSLWEDGRVMHG